MLSVVKSFFGYSSETTKVLGVARVSKKNDESLETQENILKQYKGDNINIIKVKKSAWSYNFLKNFVLPEIVKNNYKEIVFMRIDRVSRNLSHFLDFVNSLPHEIKLTIIEESELSCNLKRYSPISQDLQFEINKYQMESDIKSSRSKRDWENRRSLREINDGISDINIYREEEILPDEGISDINIYREEEILPEGFYEIEDFGERNIINGCIYYNVKWKGYQERTYERRSKLIETVKQFLIDYENEMGYGRFKRIRNN